MSKIEVSIVMPVFNASLFLREAIDSIIHQTLSNWELIIVDDASTDSSGRIIEEYKMTDNRIVLFRHDVNMGLVSSINDGLKLARGNYIARQDGDDISTPDRLEKMVAWFKENPAVGLLGSNGYYIDENGDVTKESDLPLDQEDIRNSILSLRSPFFHGSWVFRRECLEKVGFYNRILFSAEDKDFWLRVDEQFKIANHPDKLYYYRMHKNAFTSTMSYRRRLMRDLVIYLSEERRIKGKDCLGLSFGSYFYQERLPHKVVVPLALLLKSSRQLEKGDLFRSFCYLFIGTLKGLNQRVIRDLSTKLFRKQVSYIRKRL